ncbi:MAG TPA: S8 family serine peptidase [Aquabacterium sp.]|uniref:S8 family serine peptidase n=1 Tax=Aquabacterium sp. TaxID=1872578 RepID=UPI002E312814|nr:S8 family serine peptidase [Aquabacterium sp.]HEX5356890.1 S8 family serine peptidase [Aquabacterium sp.]
MPTLLGQGWHARATCLALTLSLTACGGGGGGSSTSGTPSSRGDGDTIVTLSGTLSMVETAAVDSDTNDIRQANRHANDDFDTAQALTTPVNLVGTVNEPGAGPDGPNKMLGDQVDGFVADLQTDQVVELTFSADPGKNDLELVLFSENDRLHPAGISMGTGNTECMRISQPGRYFIAVYANGGASVYNMRIGSPATASACANSTSAQALVATNQLVALPRSEFLQPVNHGRAQAQSVQTMQGFHSAAGLTQVPVPAGVPTLLTLPATASARLKGLAQVTGYTDFKRASMLSQAATLTDKRPQGLAATLDTLAYAKALMRTGQYQYVALNERVSLNQLTTGVGSFPPDDPFYPRQRWHYEQINLPAAMDRLASLATPPTRRPIVAVIDSGIMTDHPDLAGQIEGGRSFVSVNFTGDRDSANPDDPSSPDAASGEAPHFHGTHVAGTIAAQTFDGYGAAGVAPMARLMPLRVFDPGSPYASLFDILQAMRYAAGLPNRSNLLPPRKADVINMSLGSTSTCSAAYQDTINQVRQAGVIMVIASGNGANNPQGMTVPVGSPANCRGVVAVGASNVARVQAFYSQSGPELRVTAPGGDFSTSSTGDPVGDQIFSTVPNFTPEGRRVASGGPMVGTSMATPHVAGVVALMKYAYPDLTPDKLDEWLNAGKLTDDLGAPGFDTATGYGLINARKAVDVALNEARTPGVAPKGKIVANPFALDFGAQRTSMSLVLNVTAATTDVVRTISSSSAALRINKANVDPQTGLGTYTVSVDRSQLPQGTQFLTLDITTGNDSFTVEVTVVNQSGAGTARRQADYGAVYVIAMDALTNQTVDEVAVNAQNGQYTWQLRGPLNATVVLVAGADLDQNGFICEAGEPCGAYPLLSSEMTRLKLGGPIGNLNFSISPIGTGGDAQALNLGAPGSTTIRPIKHGP